MSALWTALPAAYLNHFQLKNEILDLESRVTSSMTGMHMNDLQDKNIIWRIKASPYLLNRRLRKICNFAYFNVGLQWFSAYLKSEVLSFDHLLGR